MADRLIPEPDEPESLRGRARLAALFVAVFVLLCVGSVALPHNRYVQYQLLAGSIMAPGIWGYERTEFDRTPIDVAIIGASRTQIGISGPQLERDLSARLGRRVHVANLSLLRDGRDVHYAITRQLLETHPEVKLIIYSVIEHPARISHPAFRAIATTGDVLSEPLFLNRSWLENIAYLPYRQLWTAMESAAPAAFGVRTTFDPKRYDRAFDGTVSHKAEDTGQWVDRDSIHSPHKLAADAEREISIRRPRYLPPGYIDYEYAIERHYMRKIARMAADKGVALSFVYLPVYAHAMPIEELPFYQNIGFYLDAGFVAGDYRNYSDYGHMNRIGTRRVTEWLADRLAERSRAGKLDLGMQRDQGNAR